MRELHSSCAAVLQRMRAHDAGAFEKDSRSRATLLFTRLREPRKRTPKETRTRATTTVMRMRLRGSISESRRSCTAAGTTLQCRRRPAGVQRTIVGPAARNDHIFPRNTANGVKE